MAPGPSAPSKVLKRQVPHLFHLNSTRRPRTFCPKHRSPLGVLMHSPGANGETYSDDESQGLSKSVFTVEDQGHDSWDSDSSSMVQELDINAVVAFLPPLEKSSESDPNDSQFIRRPLPGNMSFAHRDNVSDRVLDEEFVATREPTEQPTKNSLSGMNYSQGPMDTPANNMPRSSGVGEASLPDQNTLEVVGNDSASSVNSLPIQQGHIGHRHMSSGDSFHSGSIGSQSTPPPDHPLRQKQDAEGWVLEAELRRMQKEILRLEQEKTTARKDLEQERARVDMQVAGLEQDKVRLAGQVDIFHDLWRQEQAKVIEIKEEMEKLRNAGR